MKKLFSVAAVGLGLLLGSAWAQEPKTAPKAAEPAPKDVKAKASYGLGQNIGKNLEAQGLELDLDLFVKGLKDGIAGGGNMTDQQIEEALVALQKESAGRRAEKLKGKADKNKKDGDAFLAKNKTEAGVTALPSGLQYKVIKQGTGATPKLTDTVKAHYSGKLLDGTEFDSSYKRGEPTSFPVNGVIAGWTEALQLMKVGSKWELFIPGNLAYGERGNQRIPPNSVLVFQVELIGIE